MRILGDRYEKKGPSHDIVAEFRRKIGEQNLEIFLQRHPIDGTWNGELHLFCYFFFEMLNYMKTPGTVDKLSDAEEARPTELPLNGHKVRFQVLIIPYDELRPLVPMGETRGNILYRVYYKIPQEGKIVVTGVKKLSYAQPTAPDEQERSGYVHEVTGKVFFGLRNLRLRDRRRPETTSRSRRRSRSPERSRRRSRSPERSRRRSRSRSPVKKHDTLEELRLRRACAEAEARKAEAAAQKAMAESQIQQFQPWPAPPPPVLPAPPPVLPAPQHTEEGQNFFYHTPPGYGNATYWVDRSGSTK
jgi:hypothetical protein